MAKAKQKSEDIVKEIESEEFKIKAIKRKIKALKRTLYSKIDRVEKLKEKIK